MRSGPGPGLGWPVCEGPLLSPRMMRAAPGLLLMLTSTFFMLDASWCLRSASRPHSCPRTAHTHTPRLERRQQLRGKQQAPGEGWAPGFCLPGLRRAERGRRQWAACPPALSSLASGGRRSRGHALLWGEGAGSSGAGARDCAGPFHRSAASGPWGRSHRGFSVPPHCHSTLG